MILAIAFSVLVAAIFAGLIGALQIPSLRSREAISDARLQRIIEWDRKNRARTIIMDVPKKELFIWWTTNAEALAIGDKAPETLPDYVKAQYHNRRGFSCGDPKTLWVDAKFGKREIAEWPDTYISRMIQEGTSSGIVFAGSDMALFKGVPGVITDFRLRLMVL